MQKEKKLNANPGVKKVKNISRRSFLKNSSAVGVSVLSAPTIFSPTFAHAANCSNFVFQLGWLPLVQFGGHFMANEMGYLEDEGLSVEFRSGGPGIDPIADVVSGSALIGDGPVSSIVLARAAGAPIVAFGGIFHRSPLSFISLGERPVRSIQDMAGKTIAVGDRYRSQLEALIMAAGVDLGDVDLVPGGGDPAVLINGAADAVQGFATSQGVSLQQQGYDVVIAPVADLGDPSHSNVFYATEETIESCKEELIRFLRADQRGHQYAIDNPEKTAQIVQEKYGKQNGQSIEQATGSALVQGEFMKGHPNGLLWIDKDVFSSVEQFLFETGAIKSRVDSNDVVTTEFLEGI